MPNQIIQNTANWVEKVVIGLNLCPFAKTPSQNNQIRYVACDQTDPITCIEFVLNECVYLDENSGTETTLIILPNGFDTFDDYLDLLYASEDILNETGSAGVYQLASFHPAYQFQGTTLDDPANYTNKSPYPTIHIIREKSLEKALEYYDGDPDDIPERNIALTRKMGVKQLKILRDNCFSAS